MDNSDAWAIVLEAEGCESHKSFPSGVPFSEGDIYSVMELHETADDGHESMTMFTLKDGRAVVARTGADYSGHG